MTAKIEIEKSIPVPPKNVRPGGITDTVRKMKVGDSIVVDNRAFTGAVEKRLGIKLATRATGDGKFRVWRTK